MLGLLFLGMLGMSHGDCQSKVDLDLSSSSLCTSAVIPKIQSSSHLELVGLLPERQYLAGRKIRHNRVESDMINFLVLIFFVFTIVN